jgi:hypothetical protein
MLSQSGRYLTREEEFQKPKFLSLPCAATKCCSPAVVVIFLDAGHVFLHGLFLEVINSAKRFDNIPVNGYKLGYIEYHPPDIRAPGEDVTATRL